LQVQANNDTRVPDGIFEVVCNFNRQLLTEIGGRKTLVAHLVERLNDTSLEAKGDSRITRVVNGQGHLEERHTLLQIERSLLCEVHILQPVCYFHLKPCIRGTSFMAIAACIVVDLQCYLNEQNAGKSCRICLTGGSVYFSGAVDVNF